MPITITITGSGTDSLGVPFTFTTTATQEAITAAATVTPSVAPVGTTRTLAVTVSGGTPPYTFGTPVATGITFTPVSGQPGQWTFVY
jgi:hypothetical protein